MKIYKSLFACALLGLVVGCSSIKVSQDYDQSTDFSGLNTYEWKMEDKPDSGDIRVDNPLLHRRIRAAINETLRNRGYRKISAGEGAPDFSVSYKYQIRSKLESDDVGVGVGFGFGSYRSFGGIGVESGSYVSEYDQSILAIELKDADGNLLWCGLGTARFDQHAGPQAMTREINAMVGKIMSQFPP